MRGETFRLRLAVYDIRFQSTPLIRGETPSAQHGRLDHLISIHSPHTRGDGDAGSPAKRRDHFNPLPSHEGRRDASTGSIAASYFNPLPSCEGRPVRLDFDRRTKEISIHSPHARRDRKVEIRARRAAKFQSTPLTRGETTRHTLLPSGHTISIHSPHTRGDTRSWRGSMRWQNFNPLPSCEGRRRIKSRSGARPRFQSTPLIRGETAQASKNPSGFTSAYTTKP